MQRLLIVLTMSHSLRVPGNIRTLLREVLILCFPYLPTQHNVISLQTKDVDKTRDGRTSVTVKMGKARDRTRDGSVTNLC